MEPSDSDRGKTTPHFRQRGKNKGPNQLCKSAEWHARHHANGQLRRGAQHEHQQLGGHAHTGHHQFQLQQHNAAQHQQNNHPAQNVEHQQLPQQQHALPPFPPNDSWLPSITHASAFAQTQCQHPSNHNMALPPQQAVVPPSLTQSPPAPFYNQGYWWFPYPGIPPTSTEPAAHRPVHHQPSTTSSGRSSNHTSRRPNGSNSDFYIPSHTARRRDEAVEHGPVPKDELAVKNDPAVKEESSC